MKRSLGTINYYELKASIKCPVFGNGNQWWESSEERFSSLISPLSRLGGAARCHMWAVLGCHTRCHRGFSWEFQVMAAGCWKGRVSSSWGSHWVGASALSQDSVPSWGCAAMASAATKTSFLGSFCFFAYQLQIVAPALWKSVGVCQTSEYKRRGQAGGVELDSPNRGHRWCHVRSKVSILPSQKTPVHPSCPRGSGEGLGSAEQGYFHPSQEHYLTV